MNEFIHVASYSAISTSELYTKKSRLFEPTCFFFLLSYWCLDSTFLNALTLHTQSYLIWSLMMTDCDLHHCNYITFALLCSTGLGIFLAFRDVADLDGGVEQKELMLGVLPERGKTRAPLSIPPEKRSRCCCAKSSTDISLFCQNKQTKRSVIFIRT